MVKYDYDRRASSSGWTWKPLPGPAGSGYETRNGRAQLRPVGKKQWALFLDGKEHEIQSKKPGFGHAEFILRRELGNDYASRGS